MSTLRRLAERYSIATQFWDWKGNLQQINPEVIVAVLSALGVEASTEENALAALEQVELDTWRQVVKPCHVVIEGTEVLIEVHVPAGEPVSVEVVLEDGHNLQAVQRENWNPDRMIDGAMRGEATFSLGTELPLGYHRLIVSSIEGTFDSTVVVTPAFVGFPRSMQGKRVWGFATQLYSVRSKRSWGLGDLADLADLSTWAGAQHGADYVLINPLHAPQAVPPIEPSPYLPSSRRFLSPLYIRPERIPEYHDLDRELRSEIKKLAKQLRKLADPNTLERDSAWKAKREALQIIFAEPLRSVRQLAFDAFRDREGQELRRFAIWSALSEQFGSNWVSWPAQYHDPESHVVEEFAARHQEQITFYCWLQWIAQEQLAAAHTTAKQAGMTLGVITDLAVGVNATGAESWMMQDVFANGVSVGAPPDQYNQAGQDWGQPPWRPDKLEELAYAPFRDMVHAAIRSVGGVRIDHILGLFRLWWVPDGYAPLDGTYVSYNHEALVGILALEAYRAQTLVVGEDLGTVSPGIREYLSTRGILGTSVAWFEYGQDGMPLEPHKWREYSMASVTTHDLPPTIAYIRGDHVRLREQLGVLTEPVETELARAEQELAKFRTALESKGFLGRGELDPEAIMLALHRWIAASPSRVLQVSLADAVGELRAQNQPGTVDQYPNWRVPLGDSSGEPLRLEDLLGLELPGQLAAAVTHVRGS